MNKGKFFIKLVIIIPVIIFISNFLFAQEGENKSSDTNGDTITLRTIKSELDTAGEWIKVKKSEIDPEAEVSEEDGNYIGEDLYYEYVWRPNYAMFVPDWNPYRYGRWVWTNYGWVWISYYSWGWLPYHYGRWWYSHTWGWVWSPGFIWAPCWVVWYWYDNYYGWYPISPRHRWRWHRHGHHHHGHIVLYKPVLPNENNYHSWTFVNKDELNKDIVKDKIEDSRLKNKILEGTKSVYDPNVFYNGPDIKDIENATGKKIKEKTLLITNYDGTKSYTRDEDKTFENKESDNDYKGKKNKDTEEYTYEKKNPDMNTEEKNRESYYPKEKEKRKPENKDTYERPKNKQEDRNSDRQNRNDNNNNRNRENKSENQNTQRPGNSNENNRQGKR